MYVYLCLWVDELTTWVPKVRGGGIQSSTRVYWQRAPPGRHSWNRIFGFLFTAVTWMAVTWTASDVEVFKTRERCTRWVPAIASFSRYMLASTVPTLSAIQNISEYAMHHNCIIARQKCFCTLCGHMSERFLRNYKVIRSYSKNHSCIRREVRPLSIK